MEILTPFAGEMLVLCMIAILSARIFFPSRQRAVHDALSLLAPLSLIFIVLAIFGAGLRLTNLAILVLSVAAMVVNYRRLICFLQNLYIDAYSIKFSIASVLLLLLAIFFGVVLVLSRPVQFLPSRHNAEARSEFYSCDVDALSTLIEPLSAVTPAASDYGQGRAVGSTQNVRRLKGERGGAQNKTASPYVMKADEVYHRRNLTLYSFWSKTDYERDTVVLFVPDVLAETIQYRPYLVLLARAGYTVLSADLYERANFGTRSFAKNTRLLRRAFLIKDLVFKAAFGFRGAGRFGRAGAADGSGNRQRDVFAEQALHTQARAAEFKKIYECTYASLAAIAQTKYPDKKIFFVSDATAFFSEERVAAILEKAWLGSQARSLQGVFNLGDVPEYQTPGFGFVAQTSPVFAGLFLGVERDGTPYVPSVCVMRTRGLIENDYSGSEEANDNEASEAEE